MRIAPIIPGSRPELAAQEAQITAERGRISPLYQVLLNSPPMAHGWERLMSAVRNQNSLPADLREMLILRVAVLNNAPYEFDAHVPHALAAGVSSAVIEALRSPGPVDWLGNPDERLAMELTDALTKDVKVPEALFARAQQTWQTPQLVDLLVTISAYNMVSRFLVAVQIGS